MTLPAYVLQLITNATGSDRALSGEQAGSNFYGVNPRADWKAETASLLPPNRSLMPEISAGHSTHTPANEE